MSVFYCIAHDRIEDSDFVGYYVTNSGEEMCEASADEMFTEYDTDGQPIDTQGWYDNFQYDDDPNPYSGTYSED